VGLLEREATVVGQRFVVGGERAVGDAAALVTAVVAEGGVAQRQWGRLVRGAEADLLGAVDQAAVEAAAAEVDGFAVPVRGQVDGEADVGRARVDRADRAAHLAVVAQGATGEVGGGGHRGAAGGQRQLRRREREAVERGAGGHRVDGRRDHRGRAAAPVVVAVARGAVGAPAAARGEQQAQRGAGEQGVGEGKPGKLPRAVRMAHVRCLRRCRPAMPAGLAGRRDDRDMEDVRQIYEINRFDTLKI